MLNATEAAARNNQIALLKAKRLYEKLYCTKDENGNELKKTPMGTRSALPMCKPQDRVFKRPAMGKPVRTRSHNVASKFGKEMGAV